MVGLGDEFPVGWRFSTTDAAEKDQRGMLRPGVLGKWGRQCVRVGPCVLNVQDDQVRMMPPGEFQPLRSAEAEKVRNPRRSSAV